MSDRQFDMFREINPGQYEFVVELEVLTTNALFLAKNSPGYLFGKSIMTNGLPLCQRCGCHYHTMSPFGFRSVDGMVSKVIECPFCYSLDYEWASKTADVRDKKGVLAAIRFQIANYFGDGRDGMQ